MAGRPLRRPPPRKGSPRPACRTPRPVPWLTSHRHIPNRIRAPRSGRRPFPPLPLRAAPWPRASRRTRSCW
ncbi:hypothetical protein E1295_20435 [Nonomuraea mesophila]|uniref:Uncharacterized protein n=1 Tax=Nonomuraea mesophila TaxID=2530382 RepID=A0A4R5FFU8_9ACTN|nr:hypothetical protein E1295_20435 [Nonomuraea mesophila]